jgi:hypothetical protein
MSVKQLCRNSWHSLLRFNGELNMATKNIMLDWMPTTALQEFIEYHWYYLPESIAMNQSADWMLTMQELIVLLEERHLKVKLTVTPSED